MSSISEDYIRNIVNNVAPVCNLSEWSFSLEKFTNVAQNYFGVLIPVILLGKVEGKEVSFSLVFKLAPTDQRYRVSGALTAMFAREIFVYSALLARYQQLQRSLSLTEYIAPRCYYVCKEYCKEAIVMQNMCPEGYKSYTHTRFLDYDHVVLSLESLAKFHAYSFILKQQEPEFYTNDVAKTCIPLNEKTNKRFMDVLTDRLDKALEKFDGTEYECLLKTLKQNCAQFVESTAVSVEQTCICHGDIWKENILFKYMDNKPISACLIDYQTARICSPAYDVLYLITSSTDTDLRHKHIHTLLDTYYGMFDQILGEAKLDAQTVYPRTSFESDLKLVSPACLIIANTALWLSSGLQEEGHVKSKHIWSTKEEKEKAIESYKDLIKAIIDDYRSYDYL